MIQQSFMEGLFCADVVLGTGQWWRRPSLSPRILQFSSGDWEINEQLQYGLLNLANSLIFWSRHETLIKFVKINWDGECKVSSLELNLCSRKYYMRVAPYLVLEWAGRCQEKLLRGGGDCDGSWILNDKGEWLGVGWWSLLFGLLSLTEH